MPASLRAGRTGKHLIRISNRQQYDEDNQLTMTAIKSLLFLIVAPGTVLMLIPHLLLQSGYRLFTLALGPLRWIGLAPAIAGSAMLLWSFWAFTFIGEGTPAPSDPPKRFVAEAFGEKVADDADRLRSEAEPDDVDDEQQNGRCGRADADLLVGRQSQRDHG